MRSMLPMLCLMSICYARRVQSSGQEMNDAQLGMANLKYAMRDPSLLKDVARGLRSPEGRAELFKMLANPNFQQQMKALIEENGGVLADFLTPEFYAQQHKRGDSGHSLAGLLLALNPASNRAASSR